MAPRTTLAAIAYRPGKPLLATPHFTRAGDGTNNWTVFSDRSIHGGGRVASARTVGSGGSDCASQRERDGVPPMKGALQPRRVQHRPNRGARVITDQCGAVIA